jgi:hypothetical protein
MNLDKIEIDHSIDKRNNIVNIFVYLNGQQIPIQIIKGISYFRFIEENKYKCINLDKSYFSIICLNKEEDNCDNQESINYIEADRSLYNYINKNIENSINPNYQLQYKNLDLCIKRILDLYINYLIQKLNAFNLFVSKWNFNEIKLEDINKILMRDGLSEFVSNKPHNPKKKQSYLLIK